MILLLEIVAASVFVSYKNDLVSKSKLNDTVNAINNENDKGALYVMNIIQPVFHCCGCDGPSDYKNLTQMSSCETSDSKPGNPVYYKTGILYHKIFNIIQLSFWLNFDCFKGCFEAITSYMGNHLPVILGLALTMILFQVKL
jgi:hypothetical protein